MNYFTTKFGDTILAMSHLDGGQTAVVLLTSVNPHVLGSYSGYVTAIMNSASDCDYTKYFDTLAEARASFQKRAYREA
jgi:glutathione peroxidase-family protein